MTIDPAVRYMRGNDDPLVETQAPAFAPHDPGAPEGGSAYGPPWGWRRASDTPESGGTYLFGGYVTTSGLPRHFERGFIHLIRTVDGPEWTIQDPKWRHIPIEWWTEAGGPHPEHIGHREPKAPDGGVEPVRYHFLDETAVEILTAEGPVKLGSGWLAITEEEYAALRRASSRDGGTKSELSHAARDVLAERRRHVEGEGWTGEHDDSHTAGEIAAAAGTYALVASGRFVGVAKQFWPWSFGWWKPCDPRHNLVKAGALILAEIDRLDRLATEHGEW